VRTLDPRVVTLWRLEGLVASVTSAMPLYFLLAWAVSARAGWALAIGAIGALWVLLALWAVVWSGLRFRYFRFEITAERLVVEEGVIWRRTICVPRSRIQHVDTRQSFWERLLHLSRVIVYTGAGLTADASLPGLDADDAIAVRDELARARRGQDDGV
jgi:membrane protein YdbS with pleckstrin-like domain